MPDPASRQPSPVRATIRLQFHRDFTLDQGTALIPYFAALGISHIYASPLLTSRAGSTHGYDVVDPQTINAELGGEAALRRMAASLRQHQMGLIVDIVPNHMGVGGADNGWWLDVLEWGRASPYAGFFDIDWDPPDAALKNRLLAPFLGDYYGACLERGEIALRFDPQDGRFFAAYGEHRFPINPRDYPAILHHAGPALAALAGRFAALARDARDEAQAARAELRQRAAQHSVQQALHMFGPDEPGGRERLHLLLERQAFRLAWWRAAADEINWRRFFDVTSLAGMRVDEPEVFDALHETVLRLYREGLLDGLRVDHVDGLADPRGYCRKLRRRLDAEARFRPVDAPHGPAILWVEKILAHGEQLPRDWMTDGTTGYDFMNDVSALFHDCAGEDVLTSLWSRLTGRPAQFEDEAQPARRQILREALSSELWSAATALHRLARRSLDTRDVTLTALRRALEEVLVHFVAYRIYAGPGGIADRDRQVLDRAFAGARRTLRSADQPVLELMQRWLSGDDLRQVAAGPLRREWLRAMVRFQQLSAPTAAKSVEDTAFYRYGRLLSRNEVGSEPNQFCLSPAAFHQQSLRRAEHYPRALLATATHDHKRGEDSRARLAVLSEIPDEWEAALARWMRLNAKLRRHLPTTPAPDPADEIMLYQTIIGAWPYGLRLDHEGDMQDYIDRLLQWQQKALREGKRNSEWARPDEAYEQAAQDFLAAVLDPARSGYAAQDMAAFAARIAPAGALNALGQTVLRLTTPGIPDLYQGDEFWDLSLVDPDNRRPVDFAARAEALGLGLAPAALMPHWQDGRIKQAIIARILGLRFRRPGLFASGAYRKLDVAGPGADHVLAFYRQRRQGAVLVAISRLAGARSVDQPLLPAEFLRDTFIDLPKGCANRQATDILGTADDDRLKIGATLPALRAFRTLPVAVLEFA